MVFPCPGRAVKLYFSVRQDCKAVFLSPNKTLHCIFCPKNPGQKPWSKIWPKIRARRLCIKSLTVRCYIGFRRLFLQGWLGLISQKNSEPYVLAFLFGIFWKMFGTFFWKFFDNFFGPGEGPGPPKMGPGTPGIDLESKKKSKIFKNFHKNPDVSIKSIILM